MNRDSLKAILIKNNVPSYYYNLYGVGETDQRVCLEFDNGNWIVFYSERGKTFDLKQFSTEDDACQDVLNRLS